MPTEPTAPVVEWIYPLPCDCSHPNPPPCDEPAIYRVETVK
jgi:hypothetical protein